MRHISAPLVDDIKTRLVQELGHGRTSSAMTSGTTWAPTTTTSVAQITHAANHRRPSAPASSTTYPR
eukprot:12589330-Prorocentrum_lima.AAC.1